MCPLAWILEGFNLRHPLCWSKTLASVSKIISETEISMNLVVVL